MNSRLGSVRIIRISIRRKDSLACQDLVDIQAVGQAVIQEDIRVVLVDQVVFQVLVVLIQRRVDFLVVQEVSLEAEEEYQVVVSR